MFKKRKYSFAPALRDTLIHPDLNCQDLLIQLDNRCFLLVLRSSIIGQFAWKTHPRSIPVSSKNGSYLSNMPVGLGSTNSVIIHCAWSSCRQPRNSSLFCLGILALPVHHILHAGHAPKQQQQKRQQQHCGSLWNPLEPQQSIHQGVIDEVQTWDYLCSGNFTSVDSHLILNEAIVSIKYLHAAVYTSKNSKIMCRTLWVKWGTMHFAMGTL